MKMTFCGCVCACQRDSILIKLEWGHIVDGFVSAHFSYLSSSLVCVQPFVTPWTIHHQTPQSMRFSRKEYWSSQPFPPLGHLPVPEIKPMSPVSPAF